MLLKIISENFYKKKKFLTRSYPHVHIWQIHLLDIWFYSLSRKIFLSEESQMIDGLEDSLF